MCDSLVSVSVEPPPSKAINSRSPLLQNASSSRKPPSLAHRSSEERPVITSVVASQLPLPDLPPVIEIPQSSGARENPSTSNPSTTIQHSSNPSDLSEVPKVSLEVDLDESPSDFASSSIPPLLYRRAKDWSCTVLQHPAGNAKSSDAARRESREPVPQNTTTIPRAPSVGLDVDEGFCEPDDVNNSDDAGRQRVDQALMRIRMAQGPRNIRRMADLRALRDAGRPRVRRRITRRKEGRLRDPAP